jgi:IS605 OrfB family transposase
MKLTLKLKLIHAVDQKEELLKLMRLYNQACNYVSEIAFQEQEFRSYPLHHLTYQKIREEFNLPSQYAISVISTVADAYKTEMTKSTKEKRELSQCKWKKHSAIALDTRLLSYFPDKKEVTLRSLDKRLKMKLVIHNQEQFDSRKGEAKLIYNQGKFYLAQTIDIKQEEKKEINDYLGVDLGIVRIASDSDGEYYSGEIIEKKRIKYSKHRQSLKQKKSSSGRRRLKKVGNKEARFRKDINHQISKQLIEKAKDTSRGIAMESLQQFFKKETVRKSYRNQRCSWSFYQLKSYVDYKAKLAGIPVILVDPRNTSKMCSKCGYIDDANRKDQAHFVCQFCGFAANADFNASLNIKQRAEVNQPIVTRSLETLSVASPTPCGWGH